MKKIAYIFLLFSFCGITHIHAESGHVFTTQHFYALNKSEKVFIRNLSTVHASTVDSGDSDDSPFSKKRKKRKRGLLPAVISPAIGSYSIGINFEIELVYSYNTFYHFLPYFSWGERGPPPFLLVS